MKLKLSNGHYYGEDSQGNRVCRGARMGRLDTLPEDPKAPVKLRLERLKWYDGDYDAGGAYWGGGSGSDIYCAWTPEGTEVFVRAVNRHQAKTQVKAVLPGAIFYR